MWSDVDDSIDDDKKDKDPFDKGIWIYTKFPLNLEKISNSCWSEFRVPDWVKEEAKKERKP